MEFETAHLTTVHTNAEGEKIQTVYIITELELAGFLDNDIQTFTGCLYEFRSGKVEVKAAKAALDKKQRKIAQSEKMKAIHERETVRFLDDLDIE